MLRALLIALLFLPGAMAHGDTPSFDASLEVGPGEAYSFERPVHWHRVMGSIEADADVVLLVDGQVVAGPGRTLDVDHLVRCCDAIWTDMAFAIENRGDGPAAVHADLAFLHDNLAVIVDDAEPGAWWQTVLPVLVLVGVASWRARRPMDHEGTADDAHRWLLRSRVAHAVAWGLAVVLAVVGMARFGTGPLVGTLGATAVLPLDLGFLNTHSLVMLVLMLAWGTAYGSWAGSRRRGGPVWPDAIAFAAGPVLVAVLLMLEFEANWRAAVVGLVPAAAIMSDAWIRRPGLAPHTTP